MDQKAYIFMCSETTFYECMDKMLFGESDHFAPTVTTIKPGDLVYLYNVSTKRLHGEFEAVSRGAKDIDKTAWKGKFPWQVRVKRKYEYLPITKDDIEGFVKFAKGRFPNMVIHRQESDQLKEKFENAEELPSSELEFRNKFPNEYRAEDGHYVKSKDEVLIDNFLFAQGICHGYERKLPISENLYCDFWINKPGNPIVYIEYWGMDDTRYLERKESKKKIYKDNDYLLIELDKNDIKILGDVLPRKLLQLIKDIKFI